MLQTGTAELAPEEKPAPRALAQAIVDAQPPGVVQDLRDCMKEKSIDDGAWERVFVATALPAFEAKERIYFVRPAHEPYCQTFYGAHVFQFWLVAARSTDGHDTYRLDHADAADEIKVLRTTHHARNDFLVDKQTATEAFDSTMQFDGKKWSATRCTLEEFAKGTPARTVPCD